VPPPLNTQNVIAFIWDFDKTLTPGYMQDPIFEAYGVSPTTFWKEVNSLVDHYAMRGLLVSKDTAYLGHFLSYVNGGPFAGLTNEKLKELGALVPLNPGMPDFMERMKSVVKDGGRYEHNDIRVEHYIVSTGLRQMIEGNPIRKHVDGVWACELLDDPPGAGFLEHIEGVDATGVLSQVGFTIDNTTKTRAIFEINKGVNVEPSLDVNARMDSDERRVPIENMVYIADGPSDVPVFSLVGKHGGRTLGVWSDEKNYDGVMRLQDDGRVNSIERADFTEGSGADLWLTRSLRMIADRICDQRERRLASIKGPAGHAV